MAREPLVDEGVVGAEQVEHAAILGNGARNKQFRLLLERVEQAVVEVRIEVRMHHHLADAAEVEPLCGKDADQRVGRAPIRQHAPDFLVEDLRSGELAALGQIQQPLVGNAAPQEERQP